MGTKVMSLTYKVVWPTGQRRVKEDAAAVEVDIRGFDCRLAGEILTAVPRVDYSDEESAKDALEPGPRAWEAHSDIVESLPFRFRFAGSSIAPTDDEHGNPGLRRVSSLTEVNWAVDALSVVRDCFPLPPADIDIEGPVTAALPSRWRAVDAGHEPLTSAAYWMLTRVEHSFGPGRDKAAKNLRIDKKVLSRLGELSSASDPVHGRKAGREDHALTGDELGWVRAACQLVMRRVLEHEAKVEQLPLLDLEDVPSPS